MVQLIL